MYEYLHSVCSDNQQYGKLSEQEAQSWFIQIANAVCYLHEQGVVHRDLKLENILVEPQTKVAKICDFEYYCKLQPVIKFTHQYGTIEYHAPEIVAKKSYSSAVDIWALGVILYELLVGKTPFFWFFGSDIQQNILHCRWSFPIVLPLAMKLKILSRAS